MELFCNMLHKITNNKKFQHKKHTVYYDPQKRCYVKVFYYFDKVFWETHPILLDKYYPGYLIDKEHDEKSMTMSYKEIEGTPITKDRLQDLDTLDNLYTWCVSEIQRTKPYSHGDWHPTNILTKDYQTFNMIDFDCLGHQDISLQGKNHNRISY